MSVTPAYYFYTIFYYFLVHVFKCLPYIKVQVRLLFFLFPYKLTYFFRIWTIFYYHYFQIQSEMSKIHTSQWEKPPSFFLQRKKLTWVDARFMQVPDNVELSERMSTYVFWLVLLP